MPTTLRDGTDSQDVRLDRIPFFDEASRQFPIYGATPTGAQPVTKLWTIPETDVLDQGQEGACVGFGVTNELRFNPVPIPALTDGFAHDTIYWGAQKTDPWPGGSYPGATPTYEGTGVLFGIKVAAGLGYYGEYRWAFSEPEMALGVSQLGPAVIGVDWYNNMFTPDAKGFLHPTGGIAGGHCTLIIGIDVPGKFYYLYNSWGPDWGNHGVAKISRASMAKLLKAKGECCIITQRLNPAGAK